MAGNQPVSLYVMRAGLPVTDSAMQLARRKFGATWTIATGFRSGNGIRPSAVPRTIFHFPALVERAAG